jgi:hypothetical protein
MRYLYPPYFHFLNENFEFSFKFSIQNLPIWTGDPPRSRSNCLCDVLTLDFKAASPPQLTASRGCVDATPNSKLANVSSPPLPISNQNPISAAAPSTTASPIRNRLHLRPAQPRKYFSASAAPAMPSDGVDDELGGGSAAPSPARFELQEDPAFWKENNVQVGFPLSARCLLPFSPAALSPALAAGLWSNSAGSCGCVREHFVEYLSVIS